MKISKRVEDLMNKQVANEFFASYLYLSMAAYFESRSLAGFAQWMRKQADEEMKHGMKFYDFILERDGKVVLQAIPAPKNEWSSPLEIFQASLAHEQHVSSMIHGIYAAAVEEKDYPSQEFLHWFVKEQVEEESNAQFMVDRLTLAGSDHAALLMLDKQALKRKDE